MEYGKWDQRSDDRELESARIKIEDLMNDHPSDKFVIAFCGIFSSGKSSLLNELLKLNEREKLPTGIMPITKVITRIEYGRTFEASYVARGKTVSLCREQAEQIAVGNERLPEDCTEIVIKIPSALPGRNMVFLDTPGFQDNAVLDETTRLAVRQADLAVVCCHADHFGNMFEQSYFQDLEDSIGNFCVVVNQMDTVLEDEDVLALKKYVKDTICGRGADKLRHFTDKTLFYTVGAGKDIDLDGLDSFLIDLRDFEQGRRVLQEYAEKHRKLYSLKEYRKDVGERISAADRAWKEKEKELTELWNEQKRQHDSTISTIHREAETMSNFFRTRLDGKFTALYARVDRLEEKNHITGFCEKVTAEIKSIAALLVWEMYEQSKNYPALLPHHHPDRYEQALYHIVNEFHVPEPRGRRVKKRGLLGQILESITSSIELEMIWLDDGYELIYEGYAKDTNRCIREHLYRSEIDMTMEYIQSVAADAEPEEPARDRSDLDKIEQNLREWKMLDNKMQHFQNRLEWQIQKENKQRDSNNQKSSRNLSRLYKEKQQLINSVVEQMTVCADILGAPDASKEEIYGFVPGINEIEEQKHLCDRIKAIRQGLYQVMFAGGPGSGKHTLISALTHSESLGLEVQPENAVLTITVFNEPDERVVIYKREVDYNGEPVTEVMRDIPAFFQKYNMGRNEGEKFLKMVDHAVMYLKCDGIAGSLIQIVDSNWFLPDDRASTVPT